MKMKIKALYFSLAITLIAILFICEALSSQHLSYHFAFVGYGGTFKYHDLKIFGVPIYWFMLLGGFVVTFALSYHKSKEYEISKPLAIVLPIVLLITAYSGAKILFVIENFKTYKKNGLELNGVSLFGAIYLVLFVTPLIAIIIRKKVRAIYDYFTPLGLIILATTRTGCFFNGCCGAYKIWRGTTPIILPVQLFEVVCDLLILEFCFYIEKKEPQKGYMYPVFLFFYGICRFALEFLRDTPKDFLNMSHGQFFSIIAIVASLVLFLIIRKINTSTT